MLGYGELLKQVIDGQLRQLDLELLIDLEERSGKVIRMGLSLGRKKYLALTSTWKIKDISEILYSYSKLNTLT